MPSDRSRTPRSRPGRRPARRACSGCDAPAPCRSRPGRTAARPARTAAGRTRRPAPRRAGGGTCAIAPRNQVMSKRRARSEQAGAARHQHELPVPRGLELVAPSSAPGAAICGDWTRTLSSPTLPSTRSRRRAGPRSPAAAWRRAAPIWCVRARLEAELLGAAQHLGAPIVGAQRWRICICRIDLINAHRSAMGH